MKLTQCVSILTLLFASFACTSKQCECETFHDNELQSTNTYSAISSCNEYESEQQYDEYHYQVICQEK